MSKSSEAWTLQKSWRSKKKERGILGPEGAMRMPKLSAVLVWCGSAGCLRPAPRVQSLVLRRAESTAATPAAFPTFRGSSGRSDGADSNCKTSLEVLDRSRANFAGRARGLQKMVVMSPRKSSSVRADEIGAGCVASVSPLMSACLGDIEERNARARRNGAQLERNAAAGASARVGGGAPSISLVAAGVEHDRPR